MVRPRQCRRARPPATQPDQRSRQFPRAADARPRLDALLIVAETRFDRAFGDLLTRCTGTSTLARIEEAHGELIRTMLQGLRLLILMQALVAALVWVLAVPITETIGADVRAIFAFRQTALGAIFHIVAIAVTMVLAYYDLFGRILLTWSAFAIGSVVATLGAMGRRVRGLRLGLSGGRRGGRIGRAGADRRGDSEPRLPAVRRQQPRRRRRCGTGAVMLPRRGAIAAGLATMLALGSRKPALADPEPARARWASTTARRPIPRSRGRVACWCWSRTMRGRSRRCARRARRCSATSASARSRSPAPMSSQHWTRRARCGRPIRTGPTYDAHLRHPALDPRAAGGGDSPAILSKGYDGILHRHAR
ncbi:exopolysaccharide Pel transporter PelG [Sphingomonas sp. MMS24-JH45]